MAFTRSESRIAFLFPGQGSQFPGMGAIAEHLAAHGIQPVAEGLRKPDSGSCKVCGFDSTREHRTVRERMGISLQSTALPGELGVAEILELYSSFYDSPVPVADLLSQFNLTEKAGARLSSLSGGQRQRLILALALVGRPEAIFLDEPTTGLDPQSRRSLWEVILGLKAEGRAILLSTHYMEEAEALCDRIGVLDHGKLLTTGAPQDLIRRYGPGSSVSVAFAGTKAGLLADMAELPGVTRAAGEGGRFLLQTSDATATIMAVTEYVRAQELPLRELNMRSATLEDLFIALTGRGLRE